MLCNQDMRCVTFPAEWRNRGTCSTILSPILVPLSYRSSLTIRFIFHRPVNRPAWFGIGTLGDSLTFPTSALPFSPICNPLLSLSLSLSLSCFKIHAVFQNVQQRIVGRNTNMLQSSGVACKTFCKGSLLVMQTRPCKYNGDSENTVTLPASHAY